jgi:hypothetical protein
MLLGSSNADGVSYSTHDKGSSLSRLLVENLKTAADVGKPVSVRALHRHPLVNDRGGEGFLRSFPFCSKIPAPDDEVDIEFRPLRQARGSAAP